MEIRNSRRVMSGRWTWSLVFLVGIAGCGSGVDPGTGQPQTGGQSGTETEPPTCKVVSSTPIGPDDPTAEGTANELATAVAGEHRTSIRYRNLLAGTSVDTELVLEVFLDLTSAHVVTSTGRDGKPSSLCGDRLEVDGELRFETVDGAFAERFTGTLTKVRFAGTLPASELRGSFDAGALLSAYVGPYYSLYTTLSPPLSGSLSMNGGDPDSDPNTVVTSAWIADWPVPGGSAPDGGA
jgi:hypothetical protein